MKSSKLKKSWWKISLLILPLFCMSLSQCSKKTAGTLEKKPTSVTPVPDGKTTNHSSPNHSSNQAKVDSIKRLGAKKKKK